MYVKKVSFYSNYSINNINIVAVKDNWRWSHFIVSDKIAIRSITIHLKGKKNFCVTCEIISSRLDKIIEFCYFLIGVKGFLCSKLTISSWVFMILIEVWFFQDFWGDFK